MSDKLRAYFNFYGRTASMTIFFINVEFHAYGSYLAILAGIALEKSTEI